MGQAEWARDLARTLLAEPLPRRWAHTQGVAAQAETLAPILGDDADLVIAAAWLHDIGYSPDLVVTGFHPLDGARYLRDAHHADQRLCNLVAHHTCAVIEAEERGLLHELIGEFTKEDGDLTNALIYCDMTTGPDGQTLSFNDRLSDIFGRYGTEHVVSRSIRRATAILAVAVEATRARSTGRAE
jgi:putative nucleotidyltransferase with HDIG domain